MANLKIYQHHEEDETLLVVRDRGSFLKVQMHEADNYGGGPAAYIDPANVVQLRDALSAAIERNGWA